MTDEIVVPPKLVWIDLETTGSDERQDPIIEFAMVVTEGFAPFVELARYSRVVAPEGDGWSHRFSPKVLEMHVTNGLLGEIFGEFEGASPIAYVEEAAVEIVSKYGDRHDFVLAGSGVAHFDRRFIAAQMPKLDKWLRYYTIDVGVFRRTLVAMGHGFLVDEIRELPDFALADAKTHRAMDDIEGHLAELRHYAGRTNELMLHPAKLVGELS